MTGGKKPGRRPRKTPARRKQTEPLPGPVREVGEKPPATLPALRPATYNRTAKSVLYLGVIAFSVIILGLWGWSLKSQLSLVRFSASPEKELIEKTKLNWDEAFAENKKEPDEEKTTEQYIQTIMAELAADAADASSTSTN